MRAATIQLGLTGGIGSGKSTVSGFFEEMGAIVIDADAISRATTAPGGSAITSLKTIFGAGMLAADGSLDRAQMRDLIYSNPDAKTQLEAIVHPLVGQAISHQAHQAQFAGTRCVVFDIPLLVESQHWRTKLDRVLVVDCTEETQIMRVMARNGLAKEDIKKILASQASRKQRLAAADCALFNDNISLDVLRQQVHQISTQFGL